MQGGFAIDYIYAVICGGPSFARMDKAEPYPLRGRIWMYDAANVCGCTRVGAGKGRGADPDGGGFSRHLSGDGVLQVFSQTRAAPAPVSGGIVSETTIPGGGRSAPCANGGQPRGGSGRGKGTQCIARLVCCCWRCRLSGRSHIRGKIWAEDGLNSAKAASRRWSTTTVHSGNRGRPRTGGDAATGSLCTRRPGCPCWTISRRITGIIAGCSGVGR